MHSNRFMFFVLAFAVVIMSVAAFLDSPASTRAQTMGPTATATTPPTVTATVATSATATATATPGFSDTYLTLVQHAPDPTPTFTPSPTPEPQCVGFFDDFSDPNSGWPVGEVPELRARYIDGQYSLNTKEPGLYVLRSPANSFGTYTLEVDIQWAGAIGNSYGVAYGIDGGFDHFYLFDANTQNGIFRLLRIDGNNATELVPPTTSGAIALGNAVNHFKVIVRAGSQTIFINGVELATVGESTTSELDVGIVVGASSGVPEVDARYDNFCINTPAGVGDVRAKPVQPLVIKSISVPTIAE